MTLVIPYFRVFPPGNRAFPTVFAVGFVARLPTFNKLSSDFKTTSERLQPYSDGRFSVDNFLFLMVFKKLFGRCVPPAMPCLRAFFVATLKGSFLLYPIFRGWWVWEYFSI
jgi:hypothetical protein